jgi:ABC-type multidrug transport system ATPase subunit
MQLVIDSLSKTYAGGVLALKDVTLTLTNGMFGLLGPNGAGKSSLMRTIATLQEADKGTVFLDDLDVLAQQDTGPAIAGVSAAGVRGVSQDPGGADAGSYRETEGG